MNTATSSQTSKLLRTKTKGRTTKTPLIIFSLSLLLLLGDQYSRLKTLFQENKSDTTTTNEHLSWSPLFLPKSLPKNLRLLQELTSTTKSDDSCPPPLKLFENIIVPPPSDASLHRIPRIIHLSERSKCLNRDMYDALQMWHANFPSYSIFFHDDKAVDRLLQDEAYGDWASEFPDIVNILPCVSRGAMKIDIWRVLILYMFGGLYFDADMVPIGEFTQDLIHENSSWFSLSDAWERPTQGLFAASAHHLSLKNTLHTIADKVLEQGNIQKVRLVHVTGPQVLYWGWKDALVNHSFAHLEEPVTERNKGYEFLHTFTDGSWGQKIENSQYLINHSYWKEMVPIEENICVSRKARAQQHFGRVHWTKAHSLGQTGLPAISCKKHLENLLNETQVPEISTENTQSTRSNETLNSTVIADLILKNSNNATKCAEVAKAEEIRKQDLNYCGSCFWTGTLTCDKRLEYMKDTYDLSPEEALQYVLDKGGDNCKQKSTS